MIVALRKELTDANFDVGGDHHPEPYGPAP